MTDAALQHATQYLLIKIVYEILLSYIMHMHHTSTLTILHPNVIEII